MHVVRDDADRSETQTTDGFRVLLSRLDLYQSVQLDTSYLHGPQLRLDQLLLLNLH
jgi:hypothetical protein